MKKIRNKYFLKALLKLRWLVIVILLSLVQCTGQHAKPTLYIIGDSTVKNGRGDGAMGLWGWGDFIQQYVDTTKINVKNHALGGTSSRTYQTLGLWAPVLEKLQPGDYLFMQFGHNDSGKINDDSRARGTIKGVGDESQEIDNILTGEHEIVHSYGWYMRKFIQEAKSRGAIPVIFSPIPRNDWEAGKVPRNNSNSYGAWAREVAESEGILFIDLNSMMVFAMEEKGEDNVTGTYFFKWDHTHTSAEGAVLSASMVVEGIEESTLVELKDCLLEDPQVILPAKKNVYLIGDSTVANGSGEIVGWGKALSGFFVHTCVTIHNKARGGRSSRTYDYEGLWEEVVAQLQPDDIVIVQFGHNDGGNIDKKKFRGSLKGTGDDIVEIKRPDGTAETVHTYGWYMKKYITETKAKGAVPIVLSQIPRNRWSSGKVDRVNDSYGKWAKQVAEDENAIFLDLNETVASKYETLGREQVGLLFTPDKTHTLQSGANLNAQTVAELIRGCRETELRKYIILPRE